MKKWECKRCHQCLFPLPPTCTKQITAALARDFLDSLKQIEAFLQNSTLPLLQCRYPLPLPHSLAGVASGWKKWGPAHCPCCLGLP